MLLFQEETHQQRQAVRKGLHWTQPGGWKPLTELGFRAVNRGAASWEKIPAPKEMEAWPCLSKPSQEFWHKAWAHSSASGTNRTLPNTCLELKMNLLPEGVKRSLGGDVRLWKRTLSTWGSKARICLAQLLLPSSSPGASLLPPSYLGSSSKGSYRDNWDSSVVQSLGVAQGKRGSGCSLSNLWLCAKLGIYWC